MLLGEDFIRRLVGLRCRPALAPVGTVASAHYDIPVEAHLSIPVPERSDTPVSAHSGTVDGGRSDTVGEAHSYILVGEHFGTAPGERCCTPCQEKIKSSSGGVLIIYRNKFHN